MPHAAQPQACRELGEDLLQSAAALLLPLEPIRTVQTKYCVFVFQLKNAILNI
jgi:hypothetical protein